MAFLNKLRGELEKAFNPSRNISYVNAPTDTSTLEKSMKGYVTGIATQGGASQVANTYNKNTTFNPEEGRTIQPNSLRKMYYYNPIVRMAVDTIVNEVTSAQWKITLKEKETEPSEDQQAKIDEITSFFESINENHESFRMLLEMVMRDIMILDAGCIEKVRKDGKLSELWAVDAGTVTIDVDAHRKLRGYRQYIQEKIVTNYKPDDLIYIMMNPRTESVYGLSILETIHITITAYLYSESYNLKYFENNHIPKGILDVGPNIPEDQLDRFKEFWEAETQGKPHRIMILGGPISAGQDNRGTQWIPMQTSSRDMELMEYLKWLERIILACFGVSPSEVGFTENVGGAPATGQLLQSSAFRNRAIYPMLDRLAHYLTQEIIYQEFGAKDLKFEFIEEVSLQEKLQKAQLYQMEIQMGLKTVNEIRRTEGLKEMPQQPGQPGPDGQPPMPGQPPIPGQEGQPQPGQPPMPEQPMTEDQAQESVELEGKRQEVVQEAIDALTDTIKLTSAGKNLEQALQV